MQVTIKGLVVLEASPVSTTSDHTVEITVISEIPSKVEELTDTYKAIVKALKKEDK